MFDFLKKDSFTYKSEDTFFLLNDEKVEFQTINAIYSKDIEHSTNNVYQRRELIVTLQLDDTKELQLQADTDDLEKYKSLSYLQEAIIAYRYKKLHLKYLQEDRVSFSLKQDEFSLVFEDKKLFVKYNKVKRPRSIDFAVKTMKQDGFVLEFKGKGEEEVTNTWFISDLDLFLKLAPESVEYITPFETMHKRMLFNAKLYKYFMVFFIPFGLNGLSELFFDTSLLSHTEPFKSISFIAGLFLWVTIILTPFYIFVDKMNARKQQRERDTLAGRKSSVKDFDFSNLLLVVLVVGLGLFIYKNFFL